MSLPIFEQIMVNKAEETLMQYVRYGVQDEPLNLYEIKDTAIKTPVYFFSAMADQICPVEYHETL